MMPEVPPSQPATAPHPKGAEAARVWRLTAWVAGAFCLLVGLAMVVGHLGTRAEDPLKSPLLKEYK